MLEGIRLIDECDALFGRGNWRFMQDGAGCHTGAETMATLSPLVHLMRGWPPNSPDLNPNETVWGWMKHAVNLQRAETLADFRRIVQDVSDSMAQERIDNLVDSYEARIGP
jgi:transposase